MTTLGLPILLLTTLFFLQSAVELRVNEVVAPARPLNAVGSGLVIVEVRPGRDGKALTRILLGEDPYVQPSIESLRGWQFNAKTGSPSSVSTVTFLYRPATTQLAEFSAVLSQPWITATRPAVPTRIWDPGYPPACVGTGSVVLETKIDAAGNVSRVTALSGPAAFMDRAEQAVKSWKFLPAQSAGQNAQSTAFVVISFARPVS